jgi:hypothetical protein
MNLLSMHNTMTFVSSNLITDQVSLDMNIRISFILIENTSIHSTTNKLYRAEFTSYGK